MLMKKYLKKDLKFTIQDNVLVGSHLQNEQCRENENNAARIIWDSLTTYPSFVVQIDAITRQRTTFYEIKRSAIRCALWLRQRGVGEGDVVAVITHQQQDDFIPFLATLFVNAVYCPLFDDLTIEYARHYFVTCRPKIAFASTRVIEMLVEIAKETEIECEFVVYGAHQGFQSLNYVMYQQTIDDIRNFTYAEAPRGTARTLGMIFFTSGTTGTPKATKLSYDCLVQDVVPLKRNSKVGDRWLWYWPLAWVSGTMLIASMIQCRYTRILHVAQVNVEEMSNVISDHKVAVLLATPAMLTLAYKAGFDPDKYKTVRLIICCGSIVAKTILDDFKKLLKPTFIANFYGMTEAGQCLTRQTKHCKMSNSIGFVCENVMLKVTDEDTGKALSPYEQGEICFKIRTQMLGYIDDDKATKKDIVDAEGWIHTGDLGYYTKRGEIVLFDRISNFINNGTAKVSLKAIENILLGHHGVAKCAVVAVRCSTNYDRPFAFVVKVRKAEKMKADELIRLAIICNENYTLKGSLIFVDELLYTPTGKVNFNLLREKAHILVAKDKLPDYVIMKAIEKMT